MLGNDSNYIIISPVKDEEEYIEDTIESVINQTIKPARWVIVDDGSSDRTPEIVDFYRKQNPWMEMLGTNRDTARQPGAPVINAFNRGYNVVKSEAFDFVVKLDCDLRFAPDLFESLLQRFKNDPQLGIGSGIYFERHGRSWVPVKMPIYHTAGACKFMRKDCFVEIGGFVASRGWDTVDEIRAQMNGWNTRHFDDLAVYHLKAEGSGIGSLKTNAMHGEVFYLTGGSKLFFIAKVLHRIFAGKPVLVGAAMLLYGYGKSFLLRRKRLVSEDEAKFYSKLLRSRFCGRNR